MTLPLAILGGFYFVQISDIHIGGFTPVHVPGKTILDLAAEDIRKLGAPIEFVLATGDLTNSSKDEEFERYKRGASSFGVPVYNCIGRHDCLAPDSPSLPLFLFGKTPWRRHLGPTYYSFDHKGVHFVVLDPYIRDHSGRVTLKIPPKQMDWLKTDLERAKGKPIIVAMHPPLWRDPKTGKFFEPWDQKSASELLSLLRGHKVIACLSGYFHMSDEWKVDGIRVITCGALAGYRWQGKPFLTWPVYRVFRYQGERLWSFTRELFNDFHVRVVRVGDTAIVLPRPTTRIPTVKGPTRIVVEAYSRKGRIKSVRFKVDEGPWRPLSLALRDLWDEWEGTLVPGEAMSGRHTLKVEAVTEDGESARDEIYIEIKGLSLASKGRKPRRSSPPRLIPSPSLGPPAPPSSLPS